MKTIKVTLLFIGMIFCTLAAAQKPMIEVNNDKKKINVHELGLPENTPLNDVLRMLPELLSRPSSWMYENYAIEINSIDVGDARDAVLSQLRISDIKNIEVSENPISSYQNNGEGGSISINLIDLEDNGKVTGSVSLGASYPLDIFPSLNVGYKKGKFSIQALAIAEAFNQNNIVKNIDNETDNKHTSESSDYKFVTELAMVKMVYNPTANNEFTLSLSENWRKEDNATNVETTISSTGLLTSSYTDEKKLTNIFARLEYNHYFGSASKPKSEKSRLKFETTMTYKPTKELNKCEEFYSFNDDDNFKSIAGKLEYLLPLARQVRSDKMDLKIGTNFNIGNSNDDSDLNITGITRYKNVLDTEEPTPFLLDTKELTTFLSPYFQAEYINDKLSVKGIFEYQYYKYDVKSDNPHQFMQIQGQNDRYQTCNKAFTGKLMIGYRFAPNQTIRLIADRKIKRPSSSQIYPYLVLNPKDLVFIKGNPDLKPILSHEITIDYITEVDNTTNSVMMNIGFGFIQVNDVIVKSNEQLPSFFASDEYYTFLNNGGNYIAKTNFMMFYKRKVFSILFTANVFNNIGSKDYQSSDHYTYFNSMISPTFRFKYGWSFTTSLTYNSNVIKSNETLGNNLFAGIVLTKNFNRFDISASANISLLKNTKDFSDKVTTTYNAITNLFGVGFRYRF